MKVVKETKIPTVKQMKAIAFNLRKELNCHTQIELIVDAYDIPGSDYLEPKVKHRIYTSEKYNGESIRNFNSWKALMTFYKRMIST